MRLGELRDRAGLGYSDPVRGPRSPYAVVADINALIGALSRAGRQQVVPYTAHNIEIDDPDAVARAVIEVVRRSGG